MNFKDDVENLVKDVKIKLAEAKTHDDLVQVLTSIKEPIDLVLLHNLATDLGKLYRVFQKSSYFLLETDTL